MYLTCFSFLWSLIQCHCKSGCQDHTGSEYDQKNQQQRSMFSCFFCLLGILCLFTLCSHIQLICQPGRKTGIFRLCLLFFQCLFVFLCGFCVCIFLLWLIFSFFTCFFQRFCIFWGGRGTTSRTVQAPSSPSTSRAAKRKQRSSLTLCRFSPFWQMLQT